MAYLILIKPHPVKTPVKVDFFPFFILCLQKLIKKLYLESFTLVTTHNKTEFMQYRFGTHLKIVLDANDVHGKSPNRFWLNKESKRSIFRDILNI